MKRFTETTKWRDPWFRKLTPPAKLLFLWLCDHCDNAGVIDLDIECAAFDIGQTVNEQHVSELGDRLQRLPCGKIHLVKFVAFQFGDLHMDSRVHQSVYKTLCSHGLEGSVEFAGFDDFPRKRITETFRKHILSLDAYTCQWCGKQLPEISLVLDHVIPVIRGGSNFESNLVACCKNCNSEKCDSDPLEFAKLKSPLNRLSGILHTLSKKSNTLSGVSDTPKRKREVQEKEKETEKVEVKSLREGEPTNVTNATPFDPRKAKDVEEVITIGQMIGVDESDCRGWFVDCQACGWRRGDGSLFDNWPKQLTIHRDKLREIRAKKEQNEFKHNAKTDSRRPSQPASKPAPNGGWGPE